MKKLFAVLFAVFFFVPVLSAQVKSADPDVQKMQDTIKQLQDRVEKLEKEYQPVSKITDTSTLSAENENFPKSGVSQIELRDSFNDRQEAAPRPYNLTLDPTYNGFIPIPSTHALIQFNARPRVDLTNDNNYSGNDNMFVTASIPVTGDSQKGGGYQFNMNARGSRLSMDVRAPGISGNPRFYYENDFAGSGSSYLNYRVRHLYGQFHNVIVGQTYTVFEDADAWPDTVDYEGPNAAISARRPLIRYLLLFREHWGLAFSLEKPDCQVDASNDPSATSEFHAPEGGFYIKWAKAGIGHIQFSTIFRDIGVSGALVGDQTTFGWGLNLSSSIDITKHDSFQTQLTYGQGIFYFINDAISNNDAAFDANGKLQPLPVVALMGGYTHHWSNKFRSTASFGFVNLDNQYSQAWNAYHRTYYASTNVVFQLFKRLSFGLEGLYGYKQVKSHASGDVFRVQASVMYTLFK
jgi:hypothetical protein